MEVIRFVGLVVVLAILVAGANAKSVLIINDATAAAPFIPQPPKWNPIKCNSTGYSFSCCDVLDFTVDIPYEGPVHFNDSICVSLAMDPNGLNATLSIVVNGAVLFRQTVSLYDLADICVPIYPGVSVCLNWTNMYFNPATKEFSGCANIAAVLAGITVFDLPLGCFDIHGR